MKNKESIQPKAEGQPKIVGQASRLSALLPEKMWKRHLPHFQLSSAYYFITFSTYQRKKLLAIQKDIIFNTIKYLDNKKYELHAVVIMDDHAHIIIKSIHDLSNIMHSIKSFSAHKINKVSHAEGKVWQDENFERVIRNEKEYLEKLQYIINNPFKSNLIEDHKNYHWLHVKEWIN